MKTIKIGAALSMLLMAGFAYADVTSGSNSGSNSDSRSNAVGIGGGNNSGNSTATGGGNNSGNSTSGSNSDANSRSNSTANGGTGTGGSAQAGGGSADQGQSQGQQQGQRQNSQSNATQGQDASNRNTIIIKNPAQPSETTANVNQNIHTDVSGTQSIKSAPPLGLGNLSPTTPCSNTYQLGVSGMGFGVGAGGVVVDGDCTRREYARILWAMGAQEAAVGILCKNEELRAVAPVMCKKAMDDLAGGTVPNQDLPAYPSTKPVPPPPQASVTPPQTVVITPVPKPAETQAAVPVEPTITGNPPGRAAIPASPAQGTVVQGSDGSNYKFVGNAWVKIVHERQPLVPDKFEARNLSTLSKASNEVEGRDVKVD